MLGVGYVHSANPLAQAIGSAGNFLNYFRLEISAADERSDCCNDLRADVVLVIAD